MVETFEKKLDELIGGKSGNYVLFLFRFLHNLIIGSSEYTAEVVSPKYVFGSNGEPGSQIDIIQMYRAKCCALRKKI